MRVGRAQSPVPPSGISRCTRIGYFSCANWSDKREVRLRCVDGDDFGRFMQHHDDAQYVSARKAADAIAGLATLIIGLLKRYKVVYLAILQWALQKSSSGLIALLCKSSITASSEHLSCSLRLSGPGLRNNVIAQLPLSSDISWLRPWRRRLPHHFPQPCEPFFSPQPSLPT